MMLFPGAVAGIFTSDTALIQYTTWAMRIYMAGIFAMGFQIACQQSFMALGQAKVSLLLACLRKIILLIPLIFILPHVLPDAVFGVFLAEPVSDILAATITTITFFARFDKILDRGGGKNLTKSFFCTVINPIKIPFVLYLISAHPIINLASFCNTM